MVGESVGQVRNSARSLAWTVGWQANANNVQQTAVLQQVVKGMNVWTVIVFTWKFRAPQAGMWEPLECMSLS
jgi:hypothetical protein